MEKLDRSRRKFIGALISLAAGFLLLGKFLSPNVGRKKTLLAVEKASIPVHGALVYRETRVAVIREAGEIYALSLVCTHLGCSVTVTPRELVCPCHGSVFDRRGNVVKGPADRPLVRYAVEDQGDRIVVAML
ncbi:MAG: cytochrome B6 [Syntrophus sp. RIFOXYC2_FULL_54_9]|nr:MAG: cytochrome B6 [Syntrophus sp. RIFOXYC2_FULL_54_9]